MATPIGHSLFGLFIVKAGVSKALLDWRWYSFAIVAANAADFDFIPGLLLGDINLYHHGFSHSTLMGVLFGVVASGLFRFSRQRYRLAVFLCVLSYWSHLLIDMLAVDKREPYGIPIFWPISTEYIRLPWEFLAGVKHGSPGDGLIVFIRELVTWHNLETLLIEAILVLPLFGVLLVFQKRLSRKRQCAGGYTN